MNNKNHNNKKKIANERMNKRKGISSTFSVFNLVRIIFHFQLKLDMKNKRKVRKERIENETRTNRSIFWLNDVSIFFTFFFFRFSFSVLISVVSFLNRCFAAVVIVNDFYFSLLVFWSDWFICFYVHRIEIFYCINSSLSLNFCCFFFLVNILQTKNETVFSFLQIQQNEQHVSFGLIKWLKPAEIFFDSISSYLPSF